MRAEKFDRYAIFYTPEGALADAGAAWLGWDIAQGCAVAHPDLGSVDLARITATPRKYGMHGTLKPPFALAPGCDAQALGRAFQTLAQGLSRIAVTGLEVAQLGPFLALKPVRDQTALAAFAAEVVTQLDRFRAPPTAAELARRRQSNLNAAQEQHLRDWGYPYVMDQFRFHITLTGRLSRAEEVGIATAACAYFAPHLTEPFVIGSLTLAGQGADGMFYEIARTRLQQAV